MNITICVGSSCHIKGSQKVIEQLRRLVAERDLQDKIELCGAFCMGNCTNGISVTLDGELYSLTPLDVARFFEGDVLPRLEKEGGHA